MLRQEVANLKQQLVSHQPSIPLNPAQH